LNIRILFPGSARAVHFFAVLVVFALPTNAAFGFKLAYFEGEFSRILPPLEMYRQSFPASATKEDSIFVYKYLSVIYAADPSTRNKGESCMVQLIKMKPTIELLDLYISDNIASIFKDVKQSYLQQQKYVREHDLVGNTKSDSVSQSKTSSNQWIWWTTGAVGAAAIATTAVVILNDNPKSTKTSEPFKP
jgi:hypothetical protein